MSNTKKFGMLITLLFLVLVPSLLHATNAEQMQRAKTLLNIAQVADTNIKEALTELESRGVSISENALELYQEGVALAEEAAALMEKGNYSGASTTVVEALQRFKETLRLVYEVLPKTSTEAEVLAERIITLRAEVNRTYNYVNRLEQLTSRAQVAGYNSTTLKDLIDYMKDKLEHALELLDSLNVEGASRELAATRSMLNQSLVLYKRLSTDVKLVKAEVFLTATEEKFPELKANVTALSQRLPEQDKNSALTALNSAEDRLQNARAYITNAQIDETINELVEYTEKVRESLKYVQAVVEKP